MPGRRTTRRNNKVLRPGLTSHRGLLSNQLSLRSVTGGDARALERSRSNRVQRLGHEEGVLYTVKIIKKARRASDAEKPAVENGEGNVPPPQSDADVSNGHHQNASVEPQQYTISKMAQNEKCGWPYRLARSFGIELQGHLDVDSHLYKPSKALSGYINWTFYASFPAVFLSFLAQFIVLCLLFAGLIALAGEVQPDCIVVSGDDYGTTPSTKFGDAFALSWTTFTTVGYGNVYPATGMDYDIAKTQHCAGVVFLCTLEAFLGLIYAGMCAAILFGKVNRVQSHAHLSFANAVCLQYEDVDVDNYVDDDLTDSDCDDIFHEMKEDSLNNIPESPSKNSSSETGRTTFLEQFKGCPVLKFQIVNDLCNKAGGEIVDGMMKVVGIKMKSLDGTLTHTQYVRVNLVDCEHPFFGRVWHGVHILDSSSPLLKNSAKQAINSNRGSWPNDWVNSPDKIRRKLDFHSLVVTISGLSNVSASTVHAYKRYKFQDVIVGFDFAPLVYENEETGKLEVDLGLVHDVREQQKGSGEDLKKGSTVVDSTVDSVMPLLDSVMPLPKKALKRGANSITRDNFSRGTSSIFTQSTCSH